MPDSNPVATNQEQRFDALYEAHVQSVYRYARRRVPDQAEDIVADVFTVAWRRLDDVPPDGELPWLLAVARRTAANARRSQQRRDALGERIAPTLASATSGDEDGRVLAAFARLGERDQELLMLICWEGLDHAAAAGALGFSRANVAVRLHRARRRLARELGDSDQRPQGLCAWEDAWLRAGADASRDTDLSGFARVFAIAPRHPEGASEDAGGMDRSTVEATERLVRAMREGRREPLIEDRAANCAGLVRR